MQTDYSDENLVVLYYHVNDPYSTSETQARATYYNVGGTPEADWDSVSEVVGGGSTIRDIYEPIYAARKADPTPVVIRTRGFVKDDPDTSWIEATFKAVEPVSYGTLRAQFIVYENIGTLYPWTVRDVLPTANVTLSAAGDSVTVRREIVLSPSWNHANVWIATFIEKTVAPKLIVNAQNMREPYGVQVAPESYAVEMPYFGSARFYVNVKNTGAMPDSIRLDIAADFPDSVDPYEWIAIYCDPDNVCWMGPQTYYFDAGEEKRFNVEIFDYVGTVSGLGLATLTATSRGNPAKSAGATFSAFVNMPSILVVDDDGGAAYQTHVQQAIVDNGYTPLVWDASLKGRPPQLLLDDFWSVFWTTANTDGSSIKATDEAAMTGYLNGGGNLFLSSMGFLSSRAAATLFTEDYLHITSWTNNTSGFTMTGVAGDAISDSMSLGLLSGPFPPSGSDSVVLESPADGIFSASGVGLKALKVAEGDHRVVFLSFPFEDVKTAEADPNNQKTLMYRILHWFGPIPTGVDGEASLPAKLSLGQNFPNPFNPKTTLAFTVPADAGRVTLTIHNVNGRAVRTLVDGALDAGPHSILWEGTDDDGRALASGVYFARLSAGGRTRTAKMALLK
jgi:hypothetical protein